MTELSKRIADLIRTSGLTHDQIAAQSRGRLSAAAISHWCTGRRTPSHDSLLIFGATLGLSSTVITELDELRRAAVTRSGGDDLDERLARLEQLVERLGLNSAQTTQAVADLLAGQLAPLPPEQSPPPEADPPAPARRKRRSSEP